MPAPPRPRIPNSVSPSVPSTILPPRSRRRARAGGRIAVFGDARNVGTSLAALTLARALARSAKTVLIDLSSGASNLAAISTEPTAPGIVDLAAGSASFGEVITRDKLSRLHLVAIGRDPAGAELLVSPRLSMAFAALARAYDHVVVDAGTAAQADLARFLRLAPLAVLVSARANAPAAKAERDRLLKAGFVDVTVLDGAAAIAAASDRASAAA